MNEQKLVEKIKNNYVNKPKIKNQLEELKNLDKKVRSPALLFGYIFGTIGTLILGTGMCLTMKVIGDSVPWLMYAGIGIGVVGIIMISTNYLICKSMLSTRKRKYANQIIEKSNALLGIDDKKEKGE